MSSDNNLLVLLLTLKCPLECAHCIVESSPRRTEALAREDVLRLISEAAREGIDRIGFTGGEPFIRPKLLEEYHNRARSLGMDTIVITSGYFAHSQSVATKVLAPFADTSILGISTDSYHQLFTSIDRVRNCIRAAKELKFRRVELQIAYLKQEQTLSIAESLGDDLDEVVLRTQKVWPVGRAASLLLQEADTLTPLHMLDLRCPMVGPTVTPDGKVHACCSALLNLEGSDPLVLGDVFSSSLSEVLADARGNRYYEAVKSAGLGPVLRTLQANDMANDLGASYSDVCHLCYAIHSNGERATFLIDAFSGSINFRQSTTGAIGGE